MLVCRIADLEVWRVAVWVEKNGDSVEEGLRIQLSRVKFSELYQIGDIHIDLSRHVVLDGSNEIRLSPTEFAILRRLVISDGAAVPYDELLGGTENGWLDEKDAPGLIRHQLRNLRMKIKRADVGEDLIVNVRG